MAVGIFSGCSIHKWCATPSSRSLAAKLSSCVSPLHSLTTLRMLPSCATTPPPPDRSGARAAQRCSRGMLERSLTPAATPSAAAGLAANDELTDRIVLARYRSPSGSTPPSAACCGCSGGGAASGSLMRTAPRREVDSEAGPRDGGWR
eukprot:CAMPEP_0205854896 /NCGR_PEP_ID=MMETSP1083-20121108/2320_1 /ASSEMBLY_ACC=CAM_ASM_000430 /TAXON_ID=97485 /ORGANISM="Prymnesium parvum, Strain Texoma1" /LENGTH=147 /DNA_ID=CAMNT_0053216243 /DNA_START=187 /DNA_END=632 /DNA_ORIENTATION=-